jgi:hypothetical protein
MVMPLTHRRADQVTAVECRQRCRRRATAKGGSAYCTG